MGIIEGNNGGKRKRDILLFSALEWINQNVPFSPLDLDQVYKVGDTFYVVEAKGGPKALETGRLVKPRETVDFNGQAFDAYANQGSREYLDMTLTDMAKDGRPTQALALELQDAWATGKLKYINVKTIPKGEGKASFSVKQYKITR